MADKERSKTYGYRVSKELASKLRIMAKYEGRTVAGLVQVILEREVERYTKK